MRTRGTTKSFRTSSVCGRLFFRQLIVATDVYLCYMFLKHRPQIRLKESCSFVSTRNTSCLSCPLVRTGLDATFRNAINSICVLKHLQNVYEWSWTQRTPMTCLLVINTDFNACVRLRWRIRLSLIANYAMKTRKSKAQG